MQGLHHVPGFGPVFIEMRVSDEGAWYCWQQQIGQGPPATVRRKAESCAAFVPMAAVDWACMLATMRTGRARNLRGTGHLQVGRLLISSHLPEEVAQAWATARPGTTLRTKAEVILRRIWAHGPAGLLQEALAIMSGRSCRAAATAA